MSNPNNAFLSKGYLTMTIFIAVAAMMAAGIFSLFWH